MTYEEALTAPKRSWVVRDDEKEYSSLRAAAKENGLSYDSLRDNLNSGLPLKEAIKVTKEKARGPYGSHVDPYGNVFPSKQAMCEAYGVNRATYDSRIERGLSKEEALKTEPCTFYVGPDGKRYASRRELYRACGMKARPEKKEKTKKEKNCVIYIGPDKKEYTSKKEMCEANGVKYATYRRRIQKGASPDEALMKVPQKKKWMDPEGRVFNSLSALAKAHNENLSTLKGRLTRMDMSRALNDPKKRGPKKVIDHNGIEHESEKAMCSYYGVPYDTYRSKRYKLGKSLKESLHVDEKPPVTDHKGNVYKSIAEMCRAYGMNPKRYVQRLRQGWSQERALMEPINRKNLSGFHGFSGVFLFNLQGRDYYGVRCSKCGCEHALTKEMMEQHESRCPGKE